MIIELDAGQGVKICISKHLVTIDSKDGRQVYNLEKHSQELLARLVKTEQELIRTRESIANVFIGEN